MSKKRQLDDITPSPQAEKKQKIDNITIMTLREFLEIRSEKQSLLEKLSENDVDFLWKIICRHKLSKWVINPNQLFFDKTLVAFDKSAQQDMIGICSYNFLDKNKSIVALYLLCSKETEIKHVGQNLLDDMITRSQIESKEIKYIIVQSTDSAFSFYEKQGFVPPEKVERKELNNLIKNLHQSQKDASATVTSFYESLENKEISWRQYSKMVDEQKKIWEHDVDYVTNVHRNSWINDYLKYGEPIMIRSL